MCGRYSLLCIDDLGNRFRVFDPMIGSRSRFNIAPASENPVIMRTDTNHLAVMRWGLIPSWIRNMRAATPLINARAETLTDKPAFRSLLKDHRCLVPASGFFEWRVAGKKKIPHYIRLLDCPLFAFAGLFSLWRNPDGVPVSTYTIVTCPANPLVTPLHDRMPVILSQEHEERWLDPDPLTLEEMNHILVPFPAACMEAYPVSALVNNPAADGELLIQPLVSSAGAQRHLPV